MPSMSTILMLKAGVVFHEYGLLYRASVNSIYLNVIIA